MAIRGKFITFEGGEGSGKSTQIKILAEFLRDSDIEVVETREPGGSSNAEAIREYLLSGQAEGKGAKAEAMLFAAARLDHVEQVIEPALKRGTWVLCDRFMDSTRVYQGMDLDSETINVLEKIAVGDCKPDLTILLDLPAKTGLKRAASRASDAQKDRFEKEGEHIHEGRRKVFLKLAHSAPGRIFVFDATKDIKTLSADIWKRCRKQFGVRLKHQR
ncbi:MAG: dTMP kinase [Hyphomicrobiales bacterium]